MADNFKRSYNDKATAYDFYCSCVKSNNNKARRKDKKMFHQIGRSRMKQELTREIKNNDL